jgi:ubiquitin
MIEHRPNQLKILQISDV